MPEPQLKEKACAVATCLDCAYHRVHEAPHAGIADAVITRVRVYCTHGGKNLLVTPSHALFGLRCDTPIPGWCPLIKE